MQATIKFLTEECSKDLERFDLQTLLVSLVIVVSVAAFSTL